MPALPCGSRGGQLPSSSVLELISEVISIMSGLLSTSRYCAILNILVVRGKKCPRGAHAVRRCSHRQMEKVIVPSRLCEKEPHQENAAHKEGIGCNIRNSIGMLVVCHTYNILFLHLCMHAVSHSLSVVTHHSNPPCMQGPTFKTEACMGSNSTPADFWHHGF